MATLKRVVAHWAVTKYTATALARKHYHFIVEGDGKVVAGDFAPEANIKPVPGEYAAHTLNCNTGSIGVSCAAMHSAESVKKPGPYPITEVQFNAMCRKIAELCKLYSIPVTSKTVLSHAEVQDNLGIKQRGKWDISVLPFAGLATAKSCGDLMRRTVGMYMAGGKPPSTQKPVTPAPKPTTAEAKPGETLMRGHTGKYVNDLQTNLHLLGYYDGPLNSVFDANTESALKAFQARHKLLMDGKAGIRTNTAIGEALEVQKTKPAMDAAKLAVVPVATERVSPAEILTGVTAVGTGAAAVKETVDAISSGAASIVSAGPWVLAGCIGLGFAWYVWRDLRRKKAAAVAASEALR